MKRFISFKLAGALFGVFLFGMVSVGAWTLAQDPGAGALGPIATAGLLRPPEPTWLPSAPPRLPPRPGLDPYELRVAVPAVHFDPPLEGYVDGWIEAVVGDLEIRKHVVLTANDPTPSSSRELLVPLAASAQKVFVIFRVAGAAPVSLEIDRGSKPWPAAIRDWRPDIGALRAIRYSARYHAHYFTLHLVAQRVLARLYFSIG